MASLLTDSFVPAPTSPCEDERIPAVRALDVLNAAEEDIFNAVVQAAADVCRTSMAALVFADGSRQWYKSQVCDAPPPISQAMSLYSHSMDGRETLVVHDTREDPRFGDNPLVKGAPYIRFYAGVPLINECGPAIATLCVMDAKARKLNSQQKTSLEALARSAERVLQLRKNVGIAVFARAIDMASDGVTIAGDSENGMTVMYANKSFERLTGYSYLEAINQPSIFPVRAECPGLLTTLGEAARTGQMKTLDCQLLRKDGEIRWTRVSLIPYVDESGKLLYLVTVHRDISLLREAETHMQQLYAMRTTLATIEHVVRNFLNSAQLYSTYVNSKGPVEAAVQQPFEAALEEARAQIAAMKRMPSFRERPTPFGFSVLDIENKC